MDGWIAGATYEDFMGRWSRQLARRFVAWLGTKARRHWLDVGCGTGAMTVAIRTHSAPASVVGCDPSAAFIEHARRGTRDDRVSFVVAGVGALPKRAGGYGAVTSLLALNFFPDPAAAMAEMRTLASPGARISACVWDYAGGMEFLRYFWDAVVSLDPEARALDEGVRFPLCARAALEALFEDAGLTDVRTAGLEIPTRFAGFDDYWRPLLGGTGPAAAYVSSLPAPRRAALAERLRASLPRDAADAIPLVAGAWAVCGTSG